MAIYSYNYIRKWVYLLIGFIIPSPDISAIVNNLVN